jgi:hypothetical protein
VIVPDRQAYRPRDRREIKHFGCLARRGALC